MIGADTVLADVAGAVAAALRGIGYDPVVVGGSACTLHAPEAYRSDDIDLVVVDGIDNNAEVHEVMAELGFRFKNGGFIHPSNPCWVEFVKSPVAIGGDVIQEFARIDTTFGPVRVLRAADAVCDRLNKFIVWKDLDSLDVALAVARSCNVDMAEVESFIERQAIGVDRDLYMSGFGRFQRELAATTRRVSPFCFQTNVEVRFVKPPAEEVAFDSMTRIQKMLDSESWAIPGLAGVDVAGRPLVDHDRVVVPLTLRTERDLPFADKLRVATDVIVLLRDRVQVFPELSEITEDDAPPIATVGPLR